MNNAKPVYHSSDVAVKIKELEKQIVEHERRIKECHRKIQVIREYHQMFPLKEQSGLFNEAKPKKNYEIVLSILRGRNGDPVAIKELYASFLKNGGQSKRASFDVALGKWVKRPEKGIKRVGMGEYAYIPSTPAT